MRGHRAPGGGRVGEAAGRAHVVLEHPEAPVGVAHEVEPGDPDPQPAGRLDALHARLVVLRAVEYPLRHDALGDDPALPVDVGHERVERAHALGQAGLDRAPTRRPRSRAGRDRSRTPRRRPRSGRRRPRRRRGARPPPPVPRGRAPRARAWRRPPRARLKMRCDGKCQAHIHATAVSFNRRVKKPLDFRKRNNLVELRLYLCSCHSENRTVQENVFSPC